MSSNCSKSTQIENRDTMEEFFDNRITKHLKNRDTMEEIVTKDSNWVTIVEILNKGFKQGHYRGNYNKRIN